MHLNPDAEPEIRVHGCPEKLSEQILNTVRHYYNAWQFSYFKPEAP